jgi:hypothetical protein
MSTIMHPSVQSAYAYQQKASVFTRFSHWTQAQEANRFGWLAVAIVGHGCVLTPMTILLVVSLTGLNLVLFMTTLAAMAMALVVNLAAQPTKVTIPVFLISVFMDVVVIAAAIGMSIAG